MKSRFICVISVCMALIIVQTARGQIANQTARVGQNPATNEGSSSSETTALSNEDNLDMFLCFRIQIYLSLISLK